MQSESKYSYVHSFITLLAFLCIGERGRGASIEHIMPRRLYYIKNAVGIMFFVTLKLEEIYKGKNCSRFNMENVIRFF